MNQIKSRIATPTREQLAKLDRKRSRNFEPKCEEFRPRTIWSLSNAFTSAFRNRIPSAIQSDSQAGRVSGDEVLSPSD